MIISFIIFILESRIGGGANKQGIVKTKYNKRGLQ